MVMRSALYVGHVVHSRLRPRRHRLKYACYWTYLDIDELPTLAKKLRCFSYNRFNLFSLHDADYMLDARAGASLREQIESVLSSSRIDFTSGSIRLLTMPRVLGFGFNPISVFYCYDRGGSLKAIVYDVHNTFRQRHSYVVGISGGGDDQLTHECRKRFYVSPFLEMNLAYRFNITEPSENARLAVSAADDAGLILAASLSGKRKPLTDSQLIRVFATHPLLTLKVIGAIHWEALRLWLKGVRLVPRPAPPQTPVTMGHTSNSHRNSI